MSKSISVRPGADVYYLRNQNINYSFRTMFRLANKHGADMKEGDYLVIDNRNRDKRKMLRRVANGWIIVYACADEKGRFLPMSKTNGKVTKRKPMIDLLT